MYVRMDSYPRDLALAMLTKGNHGRFITNRLFDCDQFVEGD